MFKVADVGGEEHALVDQCNRGDLEVHRSNANLRRPEYVEFVTQWLRDIKADGKWTAIYKKNLPGEAPEPPLPPFDKAYYK